MVDVASSLRRAPPGFSLEQWQEFEARGLPRDRERLQRARGGIKKKWRAAVERLQARAESAAGFFTLRNFVEADAAFAGLIDHPAHVGLVYDLYGEMLKLQPSELVRSARLRRGAGKAAGAPGVSTVRRACFPTRLARWAR